MAFSAKHLLARSGGALATVSLAVSLALGLVATSAAAEPSEDPPARDAEADAPEPEQAAPHEPESIDIDALRREYLELRDRLFRSRARAHSVASALYSTELRVHLDFPRDRFVAPTRATIRLNGATVYEDTEGRIAADRAPRFEGFLAPGPHRLTIRVEAAARDDARFETASEHTFTVVAPRDHRLEVRAVAGDGGDVGYRWNRNQSGSYKLHLDIDIKAAPREAGASS
jgi:hypothetical protein